MHEPRTEDRATPPEGLRWIVGNDKYTGAWQSAAAWMHINGHLDCVWTASTSEDPCDDCWRAAAFAVKGVILADFQPRDQVLAEGAELIRSWHDRLPGEHECCDGNAAALLLAARGGEAR